MTTTITPITRGQRRRLRMAAGFQLRSSYASADGHYVGRVLRGNTELWRCGHRHHSRSFGRDPARSCGSLFYVLLTQPRLRDVLARDWRRRAELAPEYRLVSMRIGRMIVEAAALAEHLWPSGAGRVVPATSREVSAGGS